jgi:hypothetical protein
MAVEWTLEAVAGQVVVRLVQSGFGEGDVWDDFYGGTDRGWRFFTNALRHYLERHRGKKRDMVSVRRPARGGPTVPWKRVWSADGAHRNGGTGLCRNGLRARKEGVPPQRLAVSAATCAKSAFRASSLSTIGEALTVCPSA